MRNVRSVSPEVRCETSCRDEKTEEGHNEGGEVNDKAGNTRRI